MKKNSFEFAVQFGPLIKCIIVRGDTEREARNLLWSVLMSSDQQDSCSSIDMIDEPSVVDESRVGVWADM